MSEEKGFTGRGGAGNFGKIDSLADAPPTVSGLKEKYVTTGRGGAGNLIKQYNSDKTKLGHDFEPYAYIMPNRLYTWRLTSASHSIPRQEHRYVSAGRGGAGNIIENPFCDPKPGI